MNSDRDTEREKLHPMKTYLGDGLYASFDGRQIMLRAPRIDGDHRVALEPEIYARLIEFAKTINKKYAVEHFK